MFEGRVLACNKWAPCRFIPAQTVDARNFPVIKLLLRERDESRFGGSAYNGIIETVFAGLFSNKVAYPVLKFREKKRFLVHTERTKTLRSLTKLNGIEDTVFIV
jgi:hypothetical protein